MPRKFLILMMGYTGVGKSTLAKKLSKILNADIFHSAIARKGLNLTPRTKEEADEFFDYRNNLRQEIDRKVYGKMAEDAELSLKGSRSVILDAGHFFSWQRKNVYQKAISLNTELFIVKVICGDEEEIKRRLEKRARDFDDSPLNETPSWNTYIATKIMTEPSEKDKLPVGETLNIIEYDSLTGKAKFVQGNKDSENSKRIMASLTGGNKCLIQDKNFKFVEIEMDKFDKDISLEDNFVIVLDFDGVISDPYKLKTKYINELGYAITEEQCGYEVFVRQLGNSQEHYEKGLVKAFTEDPERLPLVKNFMKNFLKLKKLEGAIIFILTSRHDYMLEHLEKYLKHYRVKVDGVINTNNQNKLEHLRRVRADIFVEDSPFRLSQIFSEKESLLKRCEFALLRNKANKVEKSPSKDIIEVFNWDDLYGVIVGKYGAYGELIA